MYRHGDVILQQVKRVPKDANRRSGGVLARGEATGHSHRIADPTAVKLFDDGPDRYLEVTADSALLIHDEHKPITLPRGVYKFWQQREYSPKEIRRIID